MRVVRAAQLPTMIATPLLVTKKVQNTKHSATVPILDTLFIIVRKPWTFYALCTSGASSPDFKNPYWTWKPTTSCCCKLPGYQILSEK